VHDRDPVGVDTEADELGTGDLRHGHVLAALVEPGCQPRLDPPADPGPDRAVDDVPLLAVHVVDEHHHGLAGDKPAEERHAVLHVDHNVVRLRPAAKQVAQRLGVDAELRPSPDEPHPVAGLVGGRVLVRSAEDGDLVAIGHQVPGNRLDVPLRAAAFGVARVAPVQHDDAQRAADGVGRRHRVPSFGSGGSSWQDTVREHGPVPRPSGPRIGRRFGCR
jgi:hypothetical protein